MRAKATPFSVPPPVGGWNSRDALDAMPVEDAISLDNWFPTTGKVSVRKGFETYATGMGISNVDTLAEYHSGSTRKFVAGANGNLYDITTSTPSSIGSGYASNQWQTANFNGKLFLVNGQDAPLDWDGTTLSATSWSGSGLTISDLDGVNVFKNRLFFWDSDTQDFWYGGAAAVTGTLTKFPLSRVSQFGGNLVSMGTWTFDGGSGIDDYAVFAMSSGDVIVYQGTDPGSDFSLVGIYKIGQPLSIRGLIQFGGDLVVMTTDDFVYLSQVLRTGQVGAPSKLSGAIQEASLNSGLYGWEAVLYKQGSKLIFNIPDNDTDGNKQFVYNTTTGAACRFVGMDARCWGVYNNNLYFGGKDGAVYKAETGEDDDGSAIKADGSQAWTSFGSPQSSRITATRSVLQSVGGITYELGLGFDFNNALTPSASSTAVTGSPWDTSPWDTSSWGAGMVVSTKWRAARGIGQNVSARLRVSALQSISWLRQDYRIEQGRNL